jgi:hypothetical protein
MQVIIFPQDDNKVAVVIPAAEFSDQIEAVAAKDVPAGKPFRIINDSELPSRDSRDRWLWTESGPLDIAPEPDVAE